jgi:hypothetical protein
MAAGPAHIIVTIDTMEPIELGDFVSVFTALSNQYNNYIKLTHPDLISEARIFIQELSPGSIIADLIPFTTMFGYDSVVPYMRQMDVVADFLVEYGHKLLPFFSAKTALTAKQTPMPVSVSDLNDFFGTVTAIAKDKDGSAKIEAAYYEDRQKDVRAAIIFNTSEARTAVKRIAEERLRLDGAPHEVKSQVLMVFTQTNVKVQPLDKRTSERVKIEEIAPADKPLVYASDLVQKQIKYEIMKGDENVFKNGVIVDVAIMRKNDKIIAYKVIKLHTVCD